MNSVTKVGIVFVIICFVMVLLYNVTSEIRTQTSFDQKNELCIAITGELNKNTNESESCTAYYCYYARYTPPEGYQNITETMCICDCKTPNGTILSTQVLSPGIEETIRTKLK